MKITVDFDLQTLSADTPLITASDDQQLDIDARRSGSILGATMVSGDQIIVTGKAANNLADGAQLFTLTFTDADWHQSAGLLRQFVNYYTGTVSPPTAMYAFLQSILPAVTGALLLDVQYIPASGQPYKIGNLAVTVQAQVSSTDDGTPAPLPDAYSRFVAGDQAQTLSSGQQAQARSNIGAVNAAGAAAAAPVQSVAGRTGAVTLTSADVGLNNVTNDAQLKASQLDTDGALAANSDGKIASQKAVKTYVGNAIVGLLNDRGSYDASGNVFPSSGGSGSAGAVNKGDLWFISVAGTLGGTAITPQSTIRALTNAPGQTAGNWDMLPGAFGFTPENSANKDTDGTLSADSDTRYPSQKATKTYVDTAIAAIGSGIVRSSLALTGYTNTPAAASSASITSFISASSDGWTIGVQIDGGSIVTYEFNSASPTDGNVQLGAPTGGPGDATTLAAAITSNQPSATATSDGTGNIIIASNSSGASSAVVCTLDLSDSATGTDAVDPNEVASGTLLAGISGKAITPLNLLLFASGISGWTGTLAIAFNGGRGLLTVPITGPPDGWLPIPPGCSDGLAPGAWLLGDVALDLVASFSPATDFTTNMAAGTLTIVGSFTQQ